MGDKKEVRAQRNYKDTLFRMLFQDKNNLLSLYNAVSGTNYSNPEALEIVTLENAIYVNMKNDLAFIIDHTINLYEHQSTYSPNLPLRNLFYITREFERAVNQKTMYSSRIVKVPTPHFLVFYNGEEEWVEKEMRLSDAYEKEEKEPKLELVVTVINLNQCKNDDALKACQTLVDYMLYVEKVRGYAKEYGIDAAVNRAVKECIQEGILKDFLMRCRSEAIQMSIFEFDEEREWKLIRQDERDIGREQGIKEGLEEGKRVGIKEGIQQGINLFVRGNLLEHEADERILDKLQKWFGLNEEDAVQLLCSEKAKV